MLKCNRIMHIRIIRAGFVADRSPVRVHKILFKKGNSQMTRAKIKKIVSAALSAAMCCVITGGAVTPVYVVQYNHVVMEGIPWGGVYI